MGDGGRKNGQEAMLGKKVLLFKKFGHRLRGLSLPTDNDSVGAKWTLMK